MMVRHLLLILCFTTTFYQGHAAGELSPAGGRTFAIGTASVAQTDFWSVVNNQAANAWTTRFSAGISIENQYLIKELSYKTIGITFPFKPGNFGVIVSHFGTERFSEIKAGISFSRQFGKYFSAGVQFDYLRIQIAEGYGSKNLISFEIGLFYKATRNLQMGFHVVNPVPIKITDYPREYLPTIIRLGLSYSFSSSFLAILELEKDLTNKPVFKAGAEYRFAKPVCARIGLSTNPTLFTFGFGLEFNRFNLDLASGYQPVLGYTPALSVTYTFGKR